MQKFLLAISLLIATQLISGFNLAQAEHVDHPGLTNLKYKVYLPDQMFPPEFFWGLWQIWEPEMREKASKATPEELLDLYIERYGYQKAPFFNHGLPLGFFKTDNGMISNNCFMCHSGRINGESYIGLGGNAYSQNTFTEDMMIMEHFVKTGELLERPLQEAMGFSTSNGTSFAFLFSAIFMSVRNPDLTLRQEPQTFGSLAPVSLDAPAWWQIKKKTHLYSDAFVQKSPRALMQFALSPANSVETFKGYEKEFEQIYDYLHYVEAPKYPGEINEELGREGREIFSNRCSKCHGVYDEGAAFYPNRLVPQKLVKTNPLRLQVGLTKEFKDFYAASWFGKKSDGSDLEVRTEGNSYVAPPLDGIWATAPYLHNGSVPTLAHFLRLEPRPKFWKIKTLESYDHERMGLLVQEANEIPSVEKFYFQKRKWVDARVDSSSDRSAEGHEFEKGLTDTQKKALLEYLKTL